jgi:signal transduction histidine kinase
MVDEQNRFITDSSHELRTPLTSLRSEIEVGLRNKKLNLEEAKKIIRSNLEEVLGLQTLSDNLLELAQNGNFINKNSMKNVLLSEIIKDAVRKTDNLANKKKIKIENKIKDAKIFGISDRLTEVLVILLDNAIKYSLPKSTVQIISKIQDNTAKISVIDTGIGIEDKDLPFVFNRFYRASKSRSKTEIAGYGLGLSIAKKIIESHNGHITVESIPREKTTFTVVLPA